MASSPDTAAASLPASVEAMLRDICLSRSLDPPQPNARRQLARIGEEEALNMLRMINSTTTPIRNFTGFIIYMVQNSTPIGSLTKAIAANGVSAKRNLFPSLPVSPFASRTEFRAVDYVNCLPSLPVIGVASSSRPETPAQNITDSQLTALGELEFRKSFLILSYIGKNKLHISPDMIRNIKDLPMVDFEVEIWKAIGYLFAPEIERIKNSNWDLNRTHEYHCHIDPSGTATFKGPYLRPTRTHLQRVVGDDNVLLVKFDEGVDNGKQSAQCAIYHKIAKEGILVGLRRYHFFVFKDGGKKEKRKCSSSLSVRCYFVRTESQCAIDENKPYMLFNKPMGEARSVFMHVHMVSTMAKYMARFSLILSKTVKLEVDLASVDIICIDDVPCMDDDGHEIYNENRELLIHTDGTGFISEDLALKCPINIFKGQYSFPKDIQRILDWTKFEDKHMCSAQLKSPPLLIQCRLFSNGVAVKGTLLVNKLLPRSTIHIRPSMIKVQADRNMSNFQCVNSLEIVTTSNAPKRTFLSRNLIALLHYGGVPRDYFLGLLTDSLNDVRNARVSKKAAIRVALSNFNIGGCLVARMILCGIPLDEPHLERRLSFLMKEEKKGLKGGRLPVAESFYLMGTTDPTGKLKSNEVCVILENGQVSGEILVYRNPGLHFGDVHVSKAKYVEDLEKIVGHSKYAIFFPTKGPRSLADEIAGGDFDGDMYWVSRNQQLLKYFRTSNPWVCTSSIEKVHQPKPTDLSNEDLEKELFQQFLDKRFKRSYAMTTAADSWLSYMDRLLILKDDCAAEKDCLREKMLQLVDIYYDALDAPKSGHKIEDPSQLKTEKFPHYMEKAKNMTYTSTSVLGLIFDMVADFQNEVFPSKEIWKLPCFCTEVPSSLELWKRHFSQYRAEMAEALKLNDELKDTATENVKQKYKQILYEAPEFEVSTRAKEYIFQDALSIYHVSYDHARINNDTAKCSFAWEIAGSALCYLHAMRQEKNDTMLCLQSVLSELLG